jgi:hypothetical protein
VAEEEYLIPIFSIDCQPLGRPRTHVQNQRPIPLDLRQDNDLDVLDPDNPAGFCKGRRIVSDWQVREQETGSRLLYEIGMQEV